MNTLTITRGLPGSGKSTWAKAWVTADPTCRARVNRDDLRLMLFGKAHGLTWEQEKAVTDIAQATVAAMLRHRDVVADDMNLRPKYVKEWRTVAERAGAELDVIEFPIAADDAIERDAQRPNPVGAEAIRALAAKFMPKGKFLPLTDGEDVAIPPQPYVATQGKPDAVIVDIDGTVAHMVGRSPYEWHRVGEDEPDEVVVGLVYDFYTHLGCEIIFVSGRDEVCREATKDWLNWNVVEGFHLYMRPEGDQRKDAIVKRELFDEHIRDNFNVRFVLDDRKQVVDMWRSLGLTCLQVADGDF